MVVTPIIVAYFTAWSIYQRSYIVTDIPGDKITHINYAFANIGSDGRIALGDSWADIEKDAFHFRYNPTSYQDDLLINAFERYYQLIFFPQTYLHYLLNKSSINQNAFKYNLDKILFKANDTIMLNHLNVNIQQSSDQWLTLQSNGTYNLFTNILINNSKR
ncbi:unnamed protein product [Rotaria sp. Silwood2]|nr:unnamed protein product [Rotaria sp. Silwood2]CAF4146827.1 unnamed protein product [Rotaria sp. Silwood2]CAF4571567.1 unnamed protein product [Rotaria sp. Silwood2]